MPPKDVGSEKKECPKDPVGIVSGLGTLFDDLSWEIGSDGIARRLLLHIPLASDSLRFFEIFEILSGGCLQLAVRQLRWKQKKHNRNLNRMERMFIQLMVPR